VTRQIWYDDWAALVATLFLMTLGGIEIYSTFPPKCIDLGVLINPGAGIGFGDHYWNVGVSEGELLLKVSEEAKSLTRSNSRVAVLCCPDELCSGPGLRQSVYSTPISPRFPSTVVQDDLQNFHGFPLLPWSCLSSCSDFPMLTYLLHLGSEHHRNMCKYNCCWIFWGDLQHH
jgi:hypothetical protein